MSEQIRIYTDGSCSGNPGPGGWGVLIHGLGEPRTLSGGELSTTNNRMELTAAIRGLEALSPGSRVTVYSDSSYLVKTMTAGWKRNKNQALWRELDKLTSLMPVEWEWVKGHNGHLGNEEADRLAVAAMSKVASGLTTLASASAAPPNPPSQEVSASLSHLDSKGQARMVDISHKDETDREATAYGLVTMSPSTLRLILEGGVKKGDVFTVARIAGVGAAKGTAQLIPLAHPIPIAKIDVDFQTDQALGRVHITATVRTTGRTGVEMEALTAVAVAGLTIYDMCKAVDRSMVIGEIHLTRKRGGVHGDYDAL